MIPTKYAARSGNLYSKFRRRFFFTCVIGIIIGAAWMYLGPFDASRDNDEAKDIISEKRDAKAAKRVLDIIAAEKLNRASIVGQTHANIDLKFEEAKKSNNSEVLFATGKLLEGAGAFAQARILFETAARFNHAPSLYRSAFYAENGIGGDVDPLAARHFYEKAAEAGMADGFAAIAKMYLRGEAVAPDTDLASEYIEKGVEAGSLEARYLKGATLLAANPAKALAYLLDAAQRGNSGAQQTLARLYSEGGAVQKDEALALKWARAAAESGIAGAQVDLAKLLIRSKNTPTVDVNGAEQEAVENLLAAEVQQSGRAALEILKLVMTKPAENETDVMGARQLAIQAYEAGEKETAFAVAMTYTMTRDELKAKEWLDKGESEKDWRSIYAKELMFHSRANLRDAVGVAAKATHQSFLQYHAEHSPKSRQGVTAPVPISIKRPEFTAGLAVLGVKGEVIAEFVVNEKGIPTAIQVIDASHADLAATVVAAVSEWRFKPATRNGAAVPQKIRAPIVFRSSR